MKLAIITPTTCLDTSLSGDFLFSLAHVLLESEKRKDNTYKNFFLKHANEGRTVFLDNGAHEQELVTGSKLFELGKSIRATHIICPDVLGKTAETLEQTEKFLSELPEDEYKPKFIGVCQADNWYDFLGLYNKYLENDSIDTIAIPYDLELFDIAEIAETEAEFEKLEKFVSYRNMKTRIVAMRKLIVDRLVKKPIHLLGWSLPQEIWYQKNNFGKNLTVTNDSQGYMVYPISFKIKKELSFLENLQRLDTKHPTPEDFFRVIEDKHSKKIQNFIRDYKKLIS